MDRLRSTGTVTAGVLEKRAAHFWALALLGEPVQLKGSAAEDTSLTLQHLSVLNRHDGAAALRVASTSVRIDRSATIVDGHLTEVSSQTTYCNRQLARPDQYVAVWLGRVSSASMS